METDPSALSHMVAHAFTAVRPGALDVGAEADLAHRIETALRTAIRLEREACSELCSARAELWTSTADREATPASLKAEAGVRAREARYLEDAIRARRQPRPA